ncbi:hypothetical protein [Mesorhizobium sp. Root695]|uniref:hypothetical protein n=1 Tax=Mesorhizobium sp. Root695 TaxID=1736589 RepID=UPI0012E36C00|nr:hypothetical protein [Mesorhizobium sp. Root695]
MSDQDRCLISHEEYLLKETGKTPVRIGNVAARHRKNPRVRRQEKTERIGWTYPSEGLRAGVADVSRGDVKTMTVPIGGNWDASANALMALPL